MFVLGKSFQPNQLLFVGKAVAFPSEADSWACPQTYDLAGKAWQGQTLERITKIRKLRP